MITTKHLETEPRPTPFFFWLLLGLLASTTSLVIAISVGLQRGSSALEKSAFATALAVAVLATHGQWAPYRHLPSRWRVGALFIRLFCLVAVLYAHGAFFATALLEGGEQRAAAVMVVLPAEEPSQRPRSVSSILADLARERAAQAVLNRQSCDVGCGALRDRKTVLSARVEVLQAEVTEARRWLEDRDRLEERRAAARKDPATDELASALGMTETMTRLVFSVMMAVILDGVGCLSWRLVWRRSSTDGRRTSQVREGPTQQELHSHEMDVPVAAMDAGHDSLMTGPEAPAVTRPSGHDLVARNVRGTTEQRVAEGVERAMAALRAGQIRGTVQEIQRLIGRSQQVASAVRKALVARGELPAPASSAQPS